MSRARFDRQTLSDASTDSVRRLARFVGMAVPAGASDHWVIEQLVRKLDADAMNWPPRLTERRW
jgi:hypothetical protein